MSSQLEFVKRVMELTAELMAWKQKATDLENERDYLRGILEERLKEGAGSRTKTNLNDSAVSSATA